MICDVELLERLVILINRTAVSLDLRYEESSREWYAHIDSIAPVERWMSREGSFNQVVADTIEWLHGTLPESLSDEFKARLAAQEGAKP